MDNTKCWMKDRCNQIDCDRFCMKFFKINTLYEYSLIPYNNRKHIKLCVDDDLTDDEAFHSLGEIEKNILSFVTEGKSLFIYSSIPGNGKSSWSLRLAESYINKIWAKSTLDCKVLFISVPRLLLELKSRISKPSEYVEHIEKYVLNCDLVIWDDIATKVGTEFEISNLYNMIETRVSNGKANIYTSNLCGNELCKALGDRLYSRIVTRSEYVFEFRGKDKRGIKQEVLHN